MRQMSIGDVLRLKCFETRRRRRSGMGRKKRKKEEEEEEKKQAIQYTKLKL